MFSKNVNFKVIEEKLGHSKIKMTINRYSHLISKDENKASDYFDDLIKLVTFWSLAPFSDSFLHT